MLTEIRDWFIITGTITFTAASQVLTTGVNVPADADFVLVKLSYTSSDNADPQTLANGGALLKITDQADGRALMDAPVPLDGVAGRAQLPYILPQQHRFRRNNTISLELTNAGTATQVIRLSLHGFKVWTQLSK